MYSGRMRNNTRAHRAPTLPLYGDDFYLSQSVMMMSLEAEAIYLRLLWIAWRDGSIPSDPDKIHRMIPKIDRDWFLRLWAEVKDCWHEKDGRLYQTRLDEVRAQRLEFIDSQRRKGLLSGAARRANAVEPRFDSGSNQNATKSGSRSVEPPSPSPFPSPSPSPEGKSTTPSLDGTDGAGAHANGREDLASLPGRGGAGRGGFDLLLEVGYRSKSTTRTVDILAALRKFHAEGGDDVALKKLAGRARRKGRDPGAMMAKWLDESEWQKELQRR